MPPKPAGKSVEKSSRNKKKPELDDDIVEKVGHVDEGESSSAEHLRSALDTDVAGDESEDSEAEELDRLIKLEKEKIITIKKRRLQKLRQISRSNESVEVEEEESYSDSGKVKVKSSKTRPSGICSRAPAKIQDGAVKGMDINLARNKANTVLPLLTTTSHGQPPLFYGLPDHSP